jgi:uncharacterized membrane protein YhaH (DUF805 family)
MAEVMKETPKTEKKKKLTLGGSYNAVWKKYAEFNGRLSRKGYWYFIVYNFLVALVVRLADGIIFDFDPDRYVLSAIYSLAVFIPHLSAATRRLHDKNRSGWLQLLNLIPIVG